MAAAKKKPGRPPKLTEGDKNELINALSFGESLMAACRGLNISRAAVNHARVRDKEFGTRVKKAKFLGKMRCLSFIRSADSWQSKAWIAERVHGMYAERPDTFTKEQVIDIGIRMTQVAMRHVPQESWQLYQDEVAIILGDIANHKRKVKKDHGDGKGGG